jgi:trimeric autotransporter adhesin
MKKKFYLMVILFSLAGRLVAYSQSIGIGTASPNGSAQLDITSASKGLLIPRMATAGINAISAPASGLMVYDSVKNQLMVNMGTPVAPNWQNIVSTAGWSLNGNGSTDAATSFVGTTDNQPLRFRINDQYAGEIDSISRRTSFGYRAGNNSGGANVAMGFKSLFQNSTGEKNVALGDSSMYSNTSGTYNVAAGAMSLYSNTDGIMNVAIGESSLYSNTSGNQNVALGQHSMYSNVTGQQNTAIGNYTLQANTVGSFNTAAGYNALTANTTGNYNTATGESSLFSNTTGNDNTAVGPHALYSNTSGSDNTAAGHYALYSNTDGSSNTAIGTSALFKNLSGGSNTANGYNALYGNTYGYYNTAVGTQSLYSNTTGSYNTSMGYLSMDLSSGGSYNTAVGAQSLELSPNSNYNTACGYLSLYNVTSGQYNTGIGMRSMIGAIGASYNVAVGVDALKLTTNSQFNTVVGYGSGYYYDLGYNNVIVGANSDGHFDGIYNIIAIGQGTVCDDNSQARFGNSATSSIGGYVGWTNISDGRFKKDIQEDVKGLDFILKLRPVTYKLDVTALSRRLGENHGQDWGPQMKQAIAEKEKMVFSGFIAQEVEEAAKQANYEFSGVDKPTTADGLYGLRYSEFVVPLTKAIQEQQLLIEELKKQNEQLRNTRADQQQRYEALLQRVDRLTTAGQGQQQGSQ